MKQKDVSEHTLWEQLRDNIGHKGHFSRVESPDTSPGIPDVDYCLWGVEGHIELKFIDEKPKKNWIRPTQVKWFRDRIKNGGHPWLFVLIRFEGRLIYALFKGDIVSRLAKNTDLTNIIGRAYEIWDGEMNWPIFCSYITRM